MNIEISEFLENDRSALAKLYIKVKGETFKSLDKEHQPDDFDRDTQGEEILVAKDGKLVVGFVSVWLPDNFIHHLYIDKKYQGKGIGIRLIDAVRDRVKRPLTLKCVEDNFRAVRFYEKNGWREKSNGVSENGPFIVYGLD